MVNRNYSLFTLIAVTLIVAIISSVVTTSITGNIIKVVEKGREVLHINFDSETLTQFLDISGNDNHGTKQNDVSSVSDGIVGKAGKFNGINQIVDLGSSSTLNLNNDFSISAWVKASPSGGGYIVDRFISCTELKAVYSLDVYRAGGRYHGKARLLIGNGNYNFVVSSNRIITDNRWHHIVGQIEGRTMRIFVDGVLENTLTFNGNRLSSTTDKTLIGALSHCPSSEWSGLLDEIKIYNRALTIDEIKALYQRLNEAEVYTKAEIDDKFKSVTTKKEVFDVFSKCEITPSLETTGDDTDPKNCNDVCEYYNNKCVFGRIDSQIREDEEFDWVHSILTCNLDFINFPYPVMNIGCICCSP